VCPLVHSVRAALEQVQNIVKKNYTPSSEIFRLVADASDPKFSPTVNFVPAALDYAIRQTAVG
jgi:hypothetical protein